MVPGKGLYPHGNTEWVKSSLDKSFPPGSLTAEQRNARLDKLYATGLERGNASVGYVALSLVFLREHNRICQELSSLHDLDWKDDDERLFQTARMINTCLFLKLTIEDYINHIAGIHCSGLIQALPRVSVGIEPTGSHSNSTCSTAGMALFQIS